MPSSKEVYEELKLDVSERYAELKGLAETEVVIDEYNLDGESIRSSKLHTRWLGFLGDEAIKHKKLSNLYKKLLLDRTRYYSGTQSDKYYAEYGPCHVKVLKTDLPLYLDADDHLCYVKEILEIQTQIVGFLEKTLKNISGRSFDIRAAIDWRKFEAGG